MNATTLLVGLASGVASAALSTVLGTGSLLSLILFLFAPLPIFLAALGWRHHAGFIGAALATLILAATMGFDTARGYALSVGFPGWWLAYLALLGQPADPTQPEKGVLWYPVGQLIVWTAGIGAALVLVTLLMHGGSVEAYRGALRTTFEQFLRVETGTADGAAPTLPGGADPARIIELAIVALPPLAAALWATVSLINLWAAGRIVRASGRLARQWPDLAAFRLPPLALFAFAGGLGFSAMGGVFGFTAGVIGAAFTVPFAALGLALLHMGTRGRAARPLTLGAAYFLLIVQNWLIVVIAALGVIEFLFGIRARMQQAQPPQDIKK